MDVRAENNTEIHYYEVKTAGNVEQCIRDGLGQLLSYVYFENDERKIKAIISGIPEPNSNDLQFIEYLNSQLNGLTFGYFKIDQDATKE